MFDYPQQSQPQSRGFGFGSFLIVLGFVFGLAGLIYASSFALDKWNDAERVRLKRNNLQLVADNRELRQKNQQLTQQLTSQTERLNQVRKAMEGYK